MYRKKRRGWVKHIDFMILDMVCLQAAYVLAYFVRFGVNSPYRDNDYRNLAIVFLLVDFLVEIVFDSFKNVMKRGYLREAAAACKHVFLVELLTVFYMFSTKVGDLYSRASYYAMVPLYILITYIARCLWKKVVARKGYRNNKRSLLVLAPEEKLSECLQEVVVNCYNYSITAAALDADLQGEKIWGVPVVAAGRDLTEYVCREWVDEVLIPPCPEDEFPRELIHQLMEMGIAVHIGITKAGEAMGGRQQIEKVGGYTTITTSLNVADPMELFIKRAMDICGGLAGCLITLVILIIIGPVIYLSSPGPIFFAQERIGRNGRKFKMYKFRTMYPDAEERKKELMEQNRVKDGMMFKLDFDPRIIGNKVLPDGTKKEGIGSFLRKTSLDEFPQFFNILMGDMSLVGTRPPTVDEWEQYEPHHRARMAFRPGLTGLWQVSGRSNITDFEEVVKLDTQYIDDWSLGLDIKILLKTVGVVFKDEGAL